MLKFTQWSEALIANVRKTKLFCHIQSPPTHSTLPYSKRQIPVEFDLKLAAEHTKNNFSYFLNLGLKDFWWISNY